MLTKQIVIKALAEANNTAIKNAVDAKGHFNTLLKTKWQMRSLYLAQELENAKLGLSQDRHFRRSVFISYSAKTGRDCFANLKKELLKFDFEVNTGFDRADGDEGNVLKRVLKQLRRSTFYVGIISKEHQIHVDGILQWTPSVWLLEEKGMALAMQMPIVLCVENGIDENMWKKTTPLNAIHFFDENNFSNLALPVAEEINQRYNDIAFSAIGAP